MAQEKVYLELPPFTGRNVPIIEIAKAMHKDAQYVRVGLQQGIFRFGYAIKLDDSNEYNYYCQKTEQTFHQVRTCGRELQQQRTRRRSERIRAAAGL